MGLSKKLPSRNVLGVFIKKTGQKKKKRKEKERKKNRADIQEVNCKRFHSYPLKKKHRK